MQPTPLQEWANENDPSQTDFSYKGGFWDQVIFVRDKLPDIVYRMYDGNYEVAEKVAKGILALSTHKSKSVELPVFHITLPDSTECVLRCNFYDWKVSLKTGQPISCDFAGLFDPDIEINSVYCEGFPDEWVFGPFSKNQKEFTLELGSQYEVYTFFWLLVGHLAAKQKATAA